MTRHPVAARTMQTSGRPVWRVIVLVAVLAGVAAAAEGERQQADAASAGRLIQERARKMAQELVAGVLDVQIRQLEENGLASRPIHAEITSMRGNIDALVNREMREVVDLLARAETATTAERAALVKDARALVRGIVARLSMERQQILRRLRVADIAAQVRRLIDRQKQVATATESLPRQPDGRRETLTLAAIEDQRTVKTLYETFALALEDVSGWGGSVGSGAVTGLRTLKESQVAAELSSAEGSLGTLDFGGAAAAQARVIAAFESVLATLERSRGAGSGNMAAALETLRSLMERGAQVRREMEKTPLTDAAIEHILDTQAEFREEIAGLADSLRGVPEVESLLEQADASAQEATAAVFEGEQQRAVAEEGKVIGALADIAARLRQDAAMPAEARDAAALARRLDDLQKAAAEMAAVGQRQSQATQAARGNPAAAMAIERDVAAGIARIAADKDLPPVVDARLEQAAEAAAEASRSAPAGQPPALGVPQAAPDAMAQAAEAAVRAAAAEIAAAIADTERARLAARAGELSRAAEAVERAAAAERALASQAREAARADQADLAEAGYGGSPPDQGPNQAPGQAPDQPSDQATTEAMAQAAPQAGETDPGLAGEVADRLADTQQAVAEVAARMTEAVLATAPAAAATLTAAQQPMQAARREFEALAARDHQPGGPQPDGRQPGEPQPGDTPAAPEQPGPQQPPADQAGGQPSAEERAAMAADRAAELLARAAMEMRQEAAEAAQELARTAEAQADQVAAGREAAEAKLREMTLPPANQPTPPAGGQPPGLQQAVPQQAVPQQAVPQRQMEQAVANLAARETELVRDRVLAEEMMEAAREQSQAREAIAALGDALEQAAASETGEGTAAPAAASKPDAAMPDAAGPQQTAEALREAEERFADAQRTLGENAAAILEQSELANKPLREALEQASQLPAEAGDRPSGPPQVQGSQNPQDGQAGPGRKQQQQDGQARNGQPQPGQTQPGQSQQGQMAAKAEDALGTGFVPNAPERTAEMIAGSRAQDVVESLLGSERSGPQSGELAADGERPDRPSSGDGSEPSAGSPESSGPAANGPGSEETAPPSSSSGSSESAGRSQAGKQESSGKESNGKSAGQGQGSDRQAGSEGSKQNPQASDPKTGNSATGDAESGDAPQQSGGGGKGDRRTEAVANGDLRQTDGVGKGADGRAGERSGDADAAGKSFEREPWFARLPPEMRKAIRAKSQRRAPRGYEEKLDRYFQNIDE